MQYSLQAFVDRSGLKVADVHRMTSLSRQLFDHHAKNIFVCTPPDSYEINEVFIDPGLRVIYRKKRCRNCAGCKGDK